MFNDNVYFCVVVIYIFPDLIIYHKQQIYNLRMKKMFEIDYRDIIAI